MCFKFVLFSHEKVLGHWTDRDILNILVSPWLSDMKPMDIYEGTGGGD